MFIVSSGILRESFGISSGAPEEIPKKSRINLEENTPKI
jgi:hypothetical protein